MNRIFLIFLASYVVILTGACSPKKTNDMTGAHVNHSIEHAQAQIEQLIHTAYQNDRIPRTTHNDGSMVFCNDNFDWTEGFFPGICWQLYSLNKEKRFKDAAAYFQNKFKSHRFYSSNHDLGFVFNNSYGIAYKLTGEEDYRKILVDAGNSLLKRYNPRIGCIQSWNVKKGWMSTRGWQFPVIIDNMMNLELLFELSKITGDTTYQNIAVSHANKTLKNHFRSDYSSYHVVDYDIESGKVRSKETAQGYSHESAWARGQAWGLYGFTMCYRYTHNKKYLLAAENIASFILLHQKLPSDKIPYWDFNAPQIPNEPRDVSAAAIIASALLELDTYTQINFLDPAKEILASISSDSYTASVGANNNFILKHSVGSIPHDSEVDVPLIYADYYYVEALLRLKELEKKN